MMHFHLQENFPRSPAGDLGQDLGHAPAAQGATFGVKPLLFGVVQGGETPSRSPTHRAFAAAQCHGLARGTDGPCVCVSWGFAAREATRAGILIRLFLGDVT